MSDELRDAWIAAHNRWLAGDQSVSHFEQEKPGGTIVRVERPKETP